MPEIASRELAGDTVAVIRPELAELQPSETDEEASMIPVAVRDVSLPASFVGLALTAVGLVATFVHPPSDLVALLTLAALVAGGQALALQADGGPISVGAVGALASASLLGGGAAVVLALAAVGVEAALRRPPIYTTLYNLGVLTASGLAAALVFSLGPGADATIGAALFGVAAGGVYCFVNTSLLSFAISAEDGRSEVVVWRENFAWLVPHYLAYGFVGAVIAIAYVDIRIYALAVFLVPLVLMRATQVGQLRASRENTAHLEDANRTIHRQNVSLEQANRLLRSRSTDALEGLAATVDARDAYTAGHSRRVREISLKIGAEIGLSDAELEILGHAALFHDIGKIAVPDAVLMKPGESRPPSGP